MELKLSPAQIAQFERDGFLVVEHLIDAAMVDALRGACERLFRGEFETGVMPDEVNWQEGKSDPSLTRQICNAWKADRSGNLIYRKTARNFNPLVAMCGQVAVAEVEEIVEIGDLDPDSVHTPGIFVDRLVLTESEKRIEQRTITQV